MCDFDAHESCDNNTREKILEKDFYHASGEQKNSYSLV